MTRARGGRKDRGSILAALVAGIAVAAILSAVAAQEWTDVLRRDNEAEMIFRAQEISRAIKRYRKDRGALPNKLEDLMEPGTRGQYFLRHLYKDPLVKDGKWGLLYAGPGGGVVDPNLQGMPDSPTIGESTRDPQGNTLPGQERIVPGGGGGSELTGLPIAGVRSLCTEEPFRRYRDKDDYAQWQFTVFDLEPVKSNQPNASTDDGTKR